MSSETAQTLKTYRSRRDKFQRDLGVHEDRQKKSSSLTNLLAGLNNTLKVDELVKIMDGALKGFEGKVQEIDEDKGTVKVLVNMFGRETPVNLDFLQVKKV